MMDGWVRLALYNTTRIMHVLINSCNKKFCVFRKYISILIVLQNHCRLQIIRETDGHFLIVYISLICSILALKFNIAGFKAFMLKQYFFYWRVRVILHLFIYFLPSQNFWKYVLQISCYLLFADFLRVLTLYIKGVLKNSQLDAVPSTSNNRILSLTF